ncbi:MurR/RpiR family transcriptional regulator [Mesobacillus maritimus]|uniref:MurR/RpiR family transcriptional regulator n=1 Tax=Mesobacillus maritimus TaxID=1643336 RepID=UPI00203F3558|nr:MurR/RpiR family transcriptional regulator [Mesobacillus maritimus]MCM3588689.1 MurR/RpiR family transcriptional regulator [Mesobacillus maritimus]MCM3671930.1 MurR/RpiR family transcriptional regulator [Mesobacillus maritimus]
MVDISKIIQGKKLTELDVQIVQYIIDNIDHVLQKGVREIAKENYTSPATVIRLSKKLGYTGFVDMYYQLLPLIKKVEVSQSGDIEDFLQISQTDFLSHNTLEEIETFIRKVLNHEQRYIFIYATGFSAIAGEYLYKKLLVLGRKTIFASATDSVGVFENNLEDIGALVVISKSGETQTVMDKLHAAKEHRVFTASFTKETENRIAELSDLNFKILDQNKLDDRNMLPNSFFPRLLLLFEFILKQYVENLGSNQNRKK